MTSYDRFRKKVLAHYKKYGRHTLPWRNLPAGRQEPDPYRILVSEIMLQQTQVERVIPKYRLFLHTFPTIQKLAKASLGDVLRAWQGLGYNRRGKMLHDAAKEIIARHGGAVPRSHTELVELPGIGHYTAGAIRAFAYDEPDDFLETNIRTALTHEFFSQKKAIDDKSLLKMLPKVRHKTSSRLFYSALMDYGAHLKASGVRINHKSKHYTKQKPFKGSDREVRGAILRAYLNKAPIYELSFPKEKVRKILNDLKKEKLV